MAGTTLQPGGSRANADVTRRGMIATMMATAITASTGAVAMDRTSPDRDILTAFHARQHALAAIELRGDFFHCETHSPEITRRYDEAEAIVAKASAQTIPGVIAKLWVALCACGGQIISKDQQRHHAIFRRADAAALQELDLRDLEYDEGIVAQALLDLIKIGEA